MKIGKGLKDLINNFIVFCNDIVNKAKLEKELRETLIKIREDVRRIKEHLAMFEVGGVHLATEDDPEVGGVDVDEEDDHKGVAKGCCGIDRKESAKTQRSGGGQCNEVANCSGGMEECNDDGVSGNSDDD
ncbi:hypothetical protein Acr_04g0008090 [Actinidia rufa]|uniref:Uncharacterized protein n=1 Tax=Actinidia rufa TaxID=165716 RepID=A0A7J0EHY0_9ERIC|nr:hypothetical protein Acr_04g0008090 [Actinidia rufa]